MSHRFKGRVAVVTGAAGDIGRATAVLLAKEGAEVAVFDRSLDLLDETVRICQKAGARVLPLAVDQTDRHSVEAGVERVVEELDAPTILFANAGYGRFSTFLDQPVHEWDRHIAVNLTGTFAVTQCVARRMVANRAGGSIVINASSGAVQHTDLLSAYCSTKAAIRMLAIGMASELGNHRVRVNVVMPGVVETGMTTPMLNGPDGESHRGGLLSDTPVGRLGLPEDVAAAVVYFSSDDAGFVTGQSLGIDGGQTIHGHPRWYATDYRLDFEENWQVFQ